MFWFFCLPVQADKVDSREVFHISVCTLKPRFAHKDEFSRKCETSGFEYKQQSVSGEEGAERLERSINNNSNFLFFPSVLLLHVVSSALVAAGWSPAEVTGQQGRRACPDGLQDVDHVGKF